MYYSGKLDDCFCLFQVSVGINGRGFITVRSKDEIASILCFVFWHICLSLSLEILFN